MQRTKFILGGLLILAAVVYLIASSTQASAEYFMTVDELKAEGSSVVGKSLRASGAVIGDTIAYDPDTLTLSFEVAHVPGDNADIEAQAIMTGHVAEDGIFYADELLLKCPTKYEEAVPEQSEG